MALFQQVGQTGTGLIVEQLRPADQQARRARQGAGASLRFAPPDGQRDLAGVVPKYVHTIHQHGLERLQVHLARGRGKQGLRRYPSDLAQPERLEDGDVHPADVELPGAHGELRRGRECVVVVMQLLAPDEDGDGIQVGGGVVGLEVAVAPGVAQAVDDAGREDRHGRHLEGKDRDADDTEEQHVQDEQRVDAAGREAQVHIALQPVIRGALAVLGDHVGIAGIHPIEFGALEQHFLQAEHHGAVGVARLLAQGMVLAMDGNPLAGHHAGGHPHPEAKEVAKRGVEVEGPVGLVPVQVDGRGHHGDLQHDQGNEHLAPAAQTEDAVLQQIQKIHVYLNWQRRPGPTGRPPL